MLLFKNPAFIVLGALLLLQGPPPQGAPPAGGDVKIPWRPLPSPVENDEVDEIFAIRVQKAITISGEPIEDATILVKNGKIASIGKIVDIPKNAKKLDYSNLIAMPGLVVAQARAGYTPKGISQGAATKAKDGIDPAAEIYKTALANGVTTLTIVPSGQGFSGQASVIRTRGKNIDEMLRREDAYVFSNYEGGTQAKDNFKQTFEKAKEELERFEKAQKEFKDTPAPAPAPAPAGPPASQPAASQPAPAPPPAPKVAPKLDARLEPIVKVIKKERKLVIQFGGGGFNPFGGGGTDPASQILHLHEVTKTLDIDRIYIGGAGLFLVLDKISDVKASVLMSPDITLEPYTRNRVNIADELRRRGTKVAFLPPAESRDGYQTWLCRVADLVKMGYPEADALRSITLTPAEFLGLGDQIGSLAAGREADILFFDGPPLELTTKLAHVMIAGQVVPEEELQ